MRKIFICFLFTVFILTFFISNVRSEIVEPPQCSIGSDNVNFVYNETDVNLGKHVVSISEMWEGTRYDSSTIHKKNYWSDASSGILKSRISSMEYLYSSNILFFTGYQKLNVNYYIGKVSINVELRDGKEQLPVFTNDNYFNYLNKNT